MKKSLFDVGHHIVMLNDVERASFYGDMLRKALTSGALPCAKPENGKKCNILDLGAGSGLLSILASRVFADFGVEADVVAIEANPDLAVLCKETLARNGLSDTVRVVNKLSLDIKSTTAGGVDELWKDGSDMADLLVTETFGTTLLGEGALAFVPDTRDRFLKKDVGVMLPDKGCQYASLVEVDFKLMRAYNLTSTEVADVQAIADADYDDKVNLEFILDNQHGLNALKDTKYWKFLTGGIAKNILKSLSKRVCIQEVDFKTHPAKGSADEGKDRNLIADEFFYEVQIPGGSKHELTTQNRTKVAGYLSAILYDWDITYQDLTLTTAPLERNWAGEVAWGNFIEWLPAPETVNKGQFVGLHVNRVARGISYHSAVDYNYDLQNPVYSDRFDIDAIGLKGWSAVKQDVPAGSVNTFLATPKGI